MSHPLDSLITHFPYYGYFTGDCYVADYTNLNQKAKKETGREYNDLKVVISVHPFSDIESFHLKKHTGANIEYIGINLEDYPSFIQKSKNCECMFHSLSEGRRPWSLFLELKYCKEENIDNWVHKAYEQMDAMMEKMRQEGVLIPEERRVHFVYSSPDNTHKEPFGAFLVSQSDTLKSYEEKGIHLHGMNTILIATPQHLFEPKPAI